MYTADLWHTKLRTTVFTTNNNNNKTLYNNKQQIDREIVRKLKAVLCILF